ncbi:linear gramicidin synthase subunit D [bacterium BMS3Bbin09]|nr:linear gramicidin synthase subunit D [bacterium BMS3Bbin09]
MLYEYLTDRAGAQPDKVAVVHGKRTVTYEELSLGVSQIAGFLLKEGVQAGDRVGIVLENSPEYIMSYLGVHKAGGLVFLIDNMDTSVKTINVLKTLGLPVLAVIPAITNAKDLNRKRKKDILLFSSAGVYMLFVLIILVSELLELTYIDQFVTKFIM